MQLYLLFDMISLLIIRRYVTWAKELITYICTQCIPLRDLKSGSEVTGEAPTLMRVGCNLGMT